MKRIKKLLKLRQEFAEYGMVGALQAVNYELARLAKKFNLDYYSL